MTPLPQDRTKVYDPIPTLATHTLAAAFHTYTIFPILCQIDLNQNCMKQKEHFPVFLQVSTLGYEMPKVLFFFYCFSIFRFNRVE